VHFQFESKILKKVKSNLLLGVPSFSAERRHLTIIVGYNHKDEVFYVWDQREGVENPIPDPTGKKPEGTQEFTEDAFLRKHKSVIIIKPKPKRLQFYWHYNGSFARKISKTYREDYFSYCFKTPRDQSNLRIYLNHAMEARLNVELRRNRRVFVKNGEDTALEITGAKTKEGWPTKSYPKGETTITKHTDIIKLIDKESGFFSSVNEIQNKPLP
jgi:hypothetical protein